MKETVTVNRGEATISYDLLDDDKAMVIYKRIRSLADQLNTCKNYATFHEFIKGLKPNESYEITEVSLWTDSGFFVRIGQMPVQEETFDAFADEDLEAAG